VIYFLKLDCVTIAQAKLLLNGDLKIGKRYLMQKLQQCNIKYSVYRTFDDILKLELSDKNVILQVQDLSNQLNKQIDNGTIQSKTVKPQSKEKSKSTERTKVKTDNNSKKIQTQDTKSKKLQTQTQDTKIRKVQEAKKPDNSVSLNKFLEQNPQIRTLGELEKYYSRTIINKGIEQGVFFVRKGIIIH